MSDSSEEENEFTGEDPTPQEDTNGSSLGKRRSKSQPVSYNEEKDDEEEEEETNEADKEAAADENNGSDEESDEGSDDDSSEDSDDDDVPLASLAPKKPPPAANAAKKKKKNITTPTNGSKKRKAASTSTKKQPSPKKKAAATATSSSSNKSYEYASAALYGTECDKGLLIQRLLCRWWYAYTWPTNILDKAPEGYDALEGFPGVYVCTADGSSDVGKILDKRDPLAAPSFRNFCAKSVDELRELLIKALTEQMKQLDENDTITRKQVTDMLKWAKAINTSKAEKEATKILKAHSLYES